MMTMTKNTQWTNNLHILLRPYPRGKNLIISPAAFLPTKGSSHYFHIGPRGSHFRKKLPVVIPRKLFFSFRSGDSEGMYEHLQHGGEEPLSPEYMDDPPLSPSDDSEIYAHVYGDRENGEHLIKPSQIKNRRSLHAGMPFIEFTLKALLTNFLLLHTMFGCLLLFTFVVYPLKPFLK